MTGIEIAGLVVGIVTLIYEGYVQFRNYRKSRAEKAAEVEVTDHDGLHHSDSATSVASVLSESYNKVTVNTDGSCTFEDPVVAPIEEVPSKVGWFGALWSYKTSKSSLASEGQPEESVLKPVKERPTGTWNPFKAMWNGIKGFVDSGKNKFDKTIEELEVDLQVVEGAIPHLQDNPNALQKANATMDAIKAKIQLAKYHEAESGDISDVEEHNDVAYVDNRGQGEQNADTTDLLLSGGGNKLGSTDDVRQSVIGDIRVLDADPAAAAA